jgi:uncharacterized repeat protein (TIGR03803 family)
MVWAAICVLLLTSIAGTRGAERQILRGHVPSAAARATPVARLDSSKRLGLALGLPLRNQDALNQLLHQLYNPASPNYHHYLTARDFAERFGPTENDYQLLQAFARKNGFTITATHSNRTLLDVNASVADIERACHVTMRLYRHPTEGRNFYAPDAEPSVDLTVPMLTISGLDDYVIPHPMNLTKAPAGGTANATAYATGSGPRGFFIGKDFRAAYAPGVSLNGAGQSVGLFELDGYYPGDVTAYESLAGLPNVPLTTVLLDSSKGRAGANNDEVALDIAIAISMAPGLSNVIVYEGVTPNDVLNRMATDNLARQLSCSWGFNINSNTDQIFLQYAAQGQSFFQASGDNGAYSGAIVPPSDDPNVIVVGGTSLMTTTPGGAWLAETTWFGSGGGVSTTNAIPSWQLGLATATNQGSTTKRNIPDVACLADTIIWLVANNGQQGNIGGTSAAAPLWAGFTALVNQQAATNNQPSVGFINPAIYAIGQGPDYLACFHDITTGNNANFASPKKFFAVSGYDLCTGWGTPMGSNLISALLAPPDSLQITPGNFVVSGPVGGPFSPSAPGWSLTNIGAAVVNWTLANTSAWLNVSVTNGTLTSGGPATTVTASLNSAASNLSAGNYQTLLWFTNQNDAFGQSRQITLDIVTPPMIATQPTNLFLPSGATAVFTVGTANNALLFYQWLLNGTNLTDGGNIFGSATATLNVANITPDDDGPYSVIVSNAAGSVTSSNAALLVSLSSPLITLQPSSQTAFPGATVALNVRAVGGAPFTYQWQYNSNKLTDGGNISGSATSTLNISNVSAANAGNYSVIVSNGLGATPSSNALLTVASVTTPGTALTILYSFTGGNDGSNPNALMQAANGNFYGTTQNGGSNSAGTVFQMTAGGSVQELYSFTGGNDGGTPYAALAQGRDGNFYGTTFQGGTNDNGTVFMITGGGALTPLLSFFGANGDLPFAGLTLGNDGLFYGATHQGGANGHGSIYHITTNGVLSTLVSFNDSNGGFPYSGVIQGTDGNFYGTTFLGGSATVGTVFKMTTNGTLTTLITFNGTNGDNPYAGLVQGVDGSLYGVAANGGPNSNGVVFQITTAGILTNLYSFTGGGDGGNPVGGLMLGSDGNFYGTTAHGGAYNNDGTVFRLTPNGSLTTIIQFDGYNGANPQAALTPGTDGNIYGTTQNGGTQGNGVVFRLASTSAPQITAQPINQTAYLGANVIFNVSVFGAPSLVYQWQENGTNVTDGGMISGSGTHALVLSNIALTNTGSYSVVVSNSLGFVVSSNAFLQVIASPPQIVIPPINQTVAPGASAVFSVSAVGDLPLSYQWQENGTNLVDGGNISGSTTSNLTIVNVTEGNNGAYSALVSNAQGSVATSNAVLSVVPPSFAGTLITTLYSFSGGNDGASPNGLIFGSDGNLYGTTQFNGPGHHFGTVFRMTTNGVLTTLASFPGNPIGGIPALGVIQANDGNFYGSTRSGGIYFSGNVFKMTPAGVLANFYSFTGGTDGSSPAALMMQAADGNFYGTMPNGGASGVGNVFKLTPGGAFANVYSFTGGIDGSSPENPIIQASDGNFYGTTGGGLHGDGNIFKITPGGVISNLYSFTGGTDGSFPTGALVQGADGNLYGTTRFTTIAGFAFYGTLYKITTNGAFTMLYDLNNGNGEYPYAGLIQGADGNFYGTTFGGGATSDGVVYRMTSSGAYTNLVSFDGFDDGAHPESALVQGPDGSLYGTTTTGGYNGRGTVFRLTFTAAPQITTQPVPQTVIAGANAPFNVAVFGASPLFYHWLQNGTNLVDGGVITGSGTRILTLQGVAPADAGAYSVVVSNALGSVTSSGAALTVNSSAPIITQQPASQTILPGAIATLAVGAIGSPPLSYQWRANSTNLVDGGNIYGSATSTLAISNISEANAGNYSVIVSNSLGSITSSNAVVSVPSLMPAGVILTSLYSFTGGNDGGNPNGVIQAGSGTFYGTTTFGGSGSSGSVFQFTAGGGPTALYSFTNGNDGGFPYSVPLLNVDGKLYGSTFEGGAFANGAVYQLTTDGTFANVYSFTGTRDGANPQSALIRGNDGNFYGTSTSAGGNGHGGVFRMLPGGAFTNIHGFTGGSDGSVPVGALLQGPDGNIYGTTANGGTNGNGVVFKMATNGAIVWAVSFNVTNGANPQAGLARGADGNFYGTTAGGGVNGEGTIFKITTNGVMTVLYSFSGLINGINADGGSPRAALVPGSDGNFYGSAADGGPYGFGTVFKMTPAGALTTLAWFDGFSGANPDSALTQGSDGDFYGTTSSGGAGGLGVIYRLSVPLPFAFEDIEQTGGNIILTWSAAAGQMYQLQYKTNLNSTNWINLGAPITATGSSVSASDALVAGPAQRFYRVMLRP